MLAGAETGALRAFWHLSGDDLIPAVAGFVRDGGKPVPVLRLRRLHEGSAKLVQEIPLQLRGPGGRGEQVFSVEARPARYDVELGLSDAAGGWLLLARSNALEHGARVDVRLAPVQPRSAAAGAPTGEPALPPAPASDPPPQSRAREPHPASAAVAEQPGIRAVDVLARPRAGLGVNLGRGLAPEVAPPAATPAPIDPPGGAPSTPPELDSQASGLSGIPSPPSEARPEPADRAERRSNASPTAPLRYGQPAPGGTELLIEAELRLNGCAAPGSVIDLFGHPYRVGPGGRFQLLIRVDDPELIKRAIELNPPSLPDRPTDP